MEWPSSAVPTANDGPTALMSGAEGFVLAGGRSSRMGRDKALLQVGGRPLVAVALDKLRSIGVAAPRIAGALADLSSHAPVVPDLHPWCGPLSGIEAALAASSQATQSFSAGGYATVAATVPQLDAAAGRNHRRAGDCSPHQRAASAPLCCLPPGFAAFHQCLAACRQLQSHVRDERGRRPTPSQTVDVFDIERLASIDPELLGFAPLPLYHWFHNCNRPEDMPGNALVLSQ